MRVLSAAMALVLLSAVTLIAPEGPILASSVCGAEPHDPAGRPLDAGHLGMGDLGMGDLDVGDLDADEDGHCADGHCEEPCASHGCEGANACCSHTHVRAIAAGLAIVPARMPTPCRVEHVALEDEDEREGYRTVPSRPPSA